MKLKKRIKRNARRLIVAILLLVFFIFVYSSGILPYSGKEYLKKYNRLSKEKSPYLLQHKDNPVWWHPWGEEAFRAAAEENKPVFLSIGYSTCYWCHFMEKDSFEREDVAEVLNEYFISIKVDREERPDVDNIYMTALVALTGRGGWPMSMFLTPKGKPFYGATVVRREQFKNLLRQIANVWEKDPKRLLEGGDKVTARLGQMLNPSTKSQKMGEEALKDFFVAAKRSYDKPYGGFGKGNKFPRPHIFMALLRYYRRSGDSEALLMVKKTLKAMARGGLNDILAGGFHRYSTDRRFDIPHFEKMLYDNAGLVIAYLETFQVTREKEFSRVARETMDWVLSEMVHPEGGFYSAQDAGDFGEEGEYYAWHYDEVKKILSSKEFKHVRKIFALRQKGNFEKERNVFHVPAGLAYPDPGSDRLYKKARSKLLKVRFRREHPRLDDKVLTAWNGLMIAAFARGFQVLGDKKYLVASQRAAQFIRKNVVQKDGRLYRRWRDGEASKAAVLDDYAFLIHGLLELYQSDFDPQWFLWASKLQAIQDKDFWDKKSNGYFFDDGKDPTLLSRVKKYDDMALPSGNSLSALNLLRFTDFTYKEAYKKRAWRVMNSSAGRIKQSPFPYPQMLVALDYALDRSKEIAIVGAASDPRTQKLVRTLRKSFLPNKILALSDGMKSEEALVLLRDKVPIMGEPTAYVCEEGVCKLPTSDAKLLLSQAKTFIPLN